MVRHEDRNDQDKKLFIGGLSFKTDDDGLRSFFEHFGEVTDCVVMKDGATGRSRGFGFVTFAEASMVDQAQENRPHEIDGKVVDSKRAMPRGESNPENQAAVKKIFVGGMSREITSDDLQNYFNAYGTVTECQIVTTKETGESRGFGFVSFDDPDTVDKVILNRPHTINGSRADVKKALSKEEMRGLQTKAPRGGGRGGYAGGAGGNTGGYGQQQAWDGGMGGAQNYGYGGYSDYNNGASGYGMGGGFTGGYGGAGGGWNQGGMGDGFGSYQQSSYSGGPMRGGGHYNQRSGPYSGGH